MPLHWNRHPDPERPGVYYYRATLNGGRSVIVQEVSIGVWGWLIVNESDGAPLEMRNGFDDSDRAINHLGAHLNDEA